MNRSKSCNFTYNLITTREKLHYDQTLRTKKLVVTIVQYVQEVVTQFIQ